MRIELPNTVDKKCTRKWRVSDVYKCDAQEKIIPRYCHKNNIIFIDIMTNAEYNIIEKAAPL
jgi:hypothetical protein